MAAATWTLTGTRSAKAVSGSGTADAPILSTDGVSLDRVASVLVTLEADYGKTLTGTGSVLFYTLDPKMHGQSTVTIASAVAGNKVTINGIDFTAVANGATPTGNQWAVGAGGTADADSATALAAAINAASASCFATASAAAGVVTLTSTLPGTDPRSIPLAKTGNPITLSHSAIPAPWAKASSLDLNTTDTGVRRSSLAAIEVFGRVGKICAIPSSVGLSAGGLTLYVSTVDPSGNAN